MTMRLWKEELDAMAAAELGSAGTDTNVVKTPMRTRSSATRNPRCGGCEELQMSKRNERDSEGPYRALRPSIPRHGYSRLPGRQV
jgi:hypothetical protein